MRLRTQSVWRAVLAGVVCATVGCMPPALGPAASGEVEVSTPASGGEANRSDGQRVVVTRDDGRRPGGCDPRGVGDLFLAFFDAFNAGDADAVGRFVGRDFQWFAIQGVSDGADARNTTAVDRATLLQLMGERGRQRERVRFLEMAVAGADQHGANVLVALLRQADDLAPPSKGSGRYTEGKAVIDCRDRTISVWSVGTVGPTDAYVSPRFCPAPTTLLTPNAVTSCTMDLPKTSAP
jgi:hypothetical protein